MTLAEYLAARHLTQAEFAGRLGVSAATVSRWLSPRGMPSVQPMLAIYRLTYGAVTPNDIILAGVRKPRPSSRKP